MRGDKSLPTPPVVRTLTRRRLHQWTVMALAPCVLLANPGCAAIFKGGAQKVTINCNVPEATITVDGTPSAIGVVSMSREKGHIVAAEAEGYNRASVGVTTSVSGGYVALDIVLLFLITVAGIAALCVDGITGDWNDLEPDPVVLQLVPIGEGRAPRRELQRAKATEPKATEAPAARRPTDGDSAAKGIEDVPDKRGSGGVEKAPAEKHADPARLPGTDTPGLPGDEETNPTATGSGSKKTPRDARARFCPACGARFADGARFCSNCGRAR